jgi:hypothetical protein
MGQGDEPEYYREQPDRPLAAPEDIGIHSSPIGGFMPVGIYRPVPIVRFAGTILLQSFALLVLFGLLYAKSGIFTVAATALVSVAVGKRAFDRWLSEASTGWKVATVGMLALNWAIVSLGSLGR